MLRPKENSGHCEEIVLVVLLFAGLTSCTGPAQWISPGEMSDPNPEPLPIATEQIERKVLLLAYDPILGNGEKLSDYKNWYSFASLTEDFIAFIAQVSSGRVRYIVVESIEVNDHLWLEKTDGFRYTEETYLDVIERGAPRHNPDIADYAQFFDDAEYDICGRLNRGEIDELWLFGGPWFGFNESRLAGPGGFYYNSGPLPGTTCEKLFPIMGFSYERSTALMAESYGHRVEATITKVYGGWEQNRALHNWDRFGLTESLSPNFDFSGCGNIHYPPNAVYDYQYGRREGTDTVCHMFLSYPALTDPEHEKRPVSCEEWGCTQLGFFEYWFKHIPHFSGVAPDGKSNDWWQYIADPNLVLSSYSSMSAELQEDGSIAFRFEFLGSSSGFYLDISTVPEFTSDVFTRYTQGNGSPLVVQDPFIWGSYSPDQKLYWRITSNSGIQSPITTLEVRN